MIKGFILYLNFRFGFEDEVDDSDWEPPIIMRLNLLADTENVECEPDIESSREMPDEPEVNDELNEGFSDNITTMQVTSYKAICANEAMKDFFFCFLRISNF